MKFVNYPQNHEIRQFVLSYRWQRQMYKVTTWGFRFENIFFLYKKILPLTSREFYSRNILNGNMKSCLMNRETMTNSLKIGVQFFCKFELQYEFEYRGSIMLTKT